MIQEGGFCDLGLQFLERALMLVCPLEVCLSREGVEDAGFFVVFVHVLADEHGDAEKALEFALVSWPRKLGDGFDMVWIRKRAFWRDQSAQEFDCGLSDPDLIYVYFFTYIFFAICICEGNL